LPVIWGWGEGEMAVVNGWCASSQCRISPHRVQRGWLASYKPLIRAFPFV
jgi:hypothetical protein